MTYTGIIILYIVFRLKQLICDFFLQNTYMVTHKHMPWLEGGGRALFAHAGIHAMFTLAIIMFYAASLWWLAIVDFFVHTVIDRLKAVITYKKGWKHKNNAFWWIFGIDQEAHNFTHLIYIIIILKYLGVFSS